MGVPVLVAGHHLCAAARHGAHAGDQRDVARDRLRVLEGQRGRAPGPPARHAGAAAEAARGNVDHVRALLLDLVVDGGAGPEPRAIIAITLATPMMTPSMVSAERTALRRMATRAMRSVLDLQRDRLLLGEGPPAPRPRCAGSRPAVRDDAAVAEGDLAMGVLRDVVLVGDEDDGDALLAVQGLQDFHDLDARPRVEVAGRLVGQQDLRAR